MSKNRFLENLPKPDLGNIPIEEPVVNPPLPDIVKEELPEGPEKLPRIRDGTGYAPKKVLEYGVEDELIELHNKGWTSREIEEEFAKRGIIITDTTINQYLNYLKRIFNNFIKSDIDMRKKYADKMFNTFDVITKQLEEIEQKIEGATEWKEDVEYRKTIARFIELLAKVRGEIKSVTNIIEDNRTINISEMTIAIKQELTRKVEEEAELTSDEMGIILKDVELVEAVRKKKKKAVEASATG